MSVNRDLALFVDEVGVAYGRHRDLLLKSAYQMLYRVDGPALVPFAVEALAIAYRDGQPISAQRLFDGTPAERRDALKRLCRILHFRNYENIGLPELEIYFNADPDFAPADIDHVESLLTDNRIAPKLAVCEITEAVAQSREAVASLGDGLRRIGVGVAVDDFGAGASTAERLRLLKPSTVKIDGAWFRAVSRNAEARTMLPGLFARMHELGCRVLVEGIESADDLACALAAGADYLQGFLLARPALAGTVFDDCPLALEDIVPTHEPRQGRM